MEILTVKGQPRQPGGRHANERLRRSGLVPAVIYGHNEPPATVAVSRHDLELVLDHGQHVMTLQVDGAETQYLIKEVQYDHLQKTPIHVDLLRVDPNERVRVKVPLELKGTPRGTLQGGMLFQTVADLDIECPLLKIPDAIRVSVRDLAVGQQLHVRELELPPDVTLLHAPDEVVAAVRLKRIAEEPTEAVPAAEGAAVEPEVIKKGKETEEGVAEE